MSSIQPAIQQPAWTPQLEPTAENFEGQSAQEQLIQELEKEVGDLTKANNSLMSELGKLSAKVGEVVAQNKALAGANADLVAQVIRVGNENEQLRHALAQKIGGIEGQIQVNNHQQAQSDQQLKALEEIISNLNKTHEESVAKQKKLEEDVDKFEKNIQTLQSKLDDHEIGQKNKGRLYYYDVMGGYVMGGVTVAVITKVKEEMQERVPKEAIIKGSLVLSVAVGGFALGRHLLQSALYSEK